MHFYLEVPNGHCSIDTCGAELATIPFVSLIDRHLAKKQTHRWWYWQVGAFNHFFLVVLHLFTRHNFTLCAIFKYKSDLPFFAHIFACLLFPCFSLSSCFHHIHSLLTGWGVLANYDWVDSILCKHCYDSIQDADLWLDLQVLQQ